ncbi:hypothetical protein GCM10027592_56160 [Spirosoma flavus]
MKSRKNSTWLGYIEATNNRAFEPEQLHVEGMERILTINQRFHSFFHHSIPAVYLLDYSTGQYMIMGKSIKLILGYDMGDFMREGVWLLVENYHKDDLKLYNDQIFPDRLAFLKTIPPQEHPNHIFSYNFRIRTTQGDYINLLQRNCFLKSDKQGKPLITFGMVLNIEHYKTTNAVVQVVDKINDESGVDMPETVSKKHYYLREEDKLFTKREREILLWMAEGLSSKEIGEKLSISEHTIIAHRRNMHEKTNIQNATALISYAIRQGII